MRQLLCISFLDIPELHDKILKEDAEFESKEDYFKRMSNIGEYGDHTMLQTAATIFERNIVVFPVFPNPYWDVPIVPCEPSKAIYPDFTLLHYDDTFFENPHYRSIISNPNKQVNEPPTNSTAVASPTTSNPRVLVQPDYSPVLQPQSNPVIIEDSYDRMCGGIEKPIRNRDPVKEIPNNVEVGTGPGMYPYKKDIFGSLILHSILSLLQKQQERGLQLMGIL